MKSNITRRSFLAGSAGIASLAALGGLAGCSPKTEDAEKGLPSQSSESDWLGQAPEIDAQSIVETLDTDICIIGAGTAGMLAGLRAHETGTNAIILDKHFTTRYGGADWSVFGSKAQKESGIPDYDPNEVMWSVSRESGFRNDMSLVGLWVERSGEMLDNILQFLKKDVDAGEFGVVISPNPPELSRNSSITVIYDLAVCMSPDSDNSKRFAKCMAKRLDESEFVEIKWSTPAVRLMQDETNRVTGVIARNEQGEHIRINASKGVIVCAGDFSGDKAMRDEFFVKRVAEAWTDGAYTAYMEPEDLPSSDMILNTGDGIKMCCWAGGVMSEETSAYCSWCEGELSFFPFLNVNQAGRRFMNESVFYTATAPCIFEQPGGQDPFYWQVFDADYATCGMPSLLADGALGEQSVGAGRDAWIQANTLEELAALMSKHSAIQMDASVFEDEVKRYNDMCEAGFDSDFFKAAKFLKPIKNPPYYAAKYRPILAVSLEGVDVTRRCQVVDASGNPIPGLYGAGNTIGRRFGGTYSASVTGLTCGLAATHGYCAVDFCLEDN